MKVIKSLIYILFIFSYVGGAAQISTYKAMPYSRKVLDSTVARYIYQFDFVENPDNKSDKTRALTVLEVGKRYLKFTDYFQRPLDSLEQALYKQGTYSEKEFNKLDNFSDPVHYQNTLLIDLKNHRLIYQGWIDKTYQFTTKMPPLNWVLQDKMKEIKGYKVQKATTTYGGRDWVAWFAPGVKHPYGPYIFEGLPGLIFEVYDTGHNFHFLLKGNDHRNLAIYLRNEDRIHKTTEKKYRRLDRAYHRRPSTFHKVKAWSSDGTPIRLKPKPYNPIERD